MGDAKHTDIVFRSVSRDGGPDEERFVEVEDHLGRSVRIGTWVRRDDGYHCLRLAGGPSELAAAPDMLAALRAWKAWVATMDGESISMWAPQELALASAIEKGAAALAKVEGRDE